MNLNWVFSGTFCIRYDQLNRCLLYQLWTVSGYLPVNSFRLFTCSELMGKNYRFICWIYSKKNSDLWIDFRRNKNLYCIGWSGNILASTRKIWFVVWYGRRFKHTTSYSSKRYWYYVMVREASVWPYNNSNCGPQNLSVFFCNLNLPATCILESCSEIQISLNFYFNTFLWWFLKRFYEGLMFKVNCKDTRTTPIATFWCLYC